MDNNQTMHKKALRSGPTVLLGSIWVCVAAGCASVGDDSLKQDVKQTTTKVETVATKVVTVGATTAKDAYGRMQHYLAEKDVLKTFTDAGEHSETEVLAMLHRNRVTPAAKSSPGPGTKPPAGATGSASVAAGNHARPALPQDYQGSMRWPLDAGVVSSEYGARWGKIHKGIDIAADSGEPVYAVADGQVIYAGDGLRGYGNVVIIQHDRRITSLYAHNRQLKVKQGDKVTKGTLVALLGSTGHSTGPHVHFEIRDNDTAVNPRSRLPKSSLADAGGQVAVDPDVQLASR